MRGTTPLQGLFGHWQLANAVLIDRAGKLQSWAEARHVMAVLDRVLAQPAGAAGS